MSDLRVDAGNCDFPEPHPPHLWIGQTATSPEGHLTTYYNPQMFSCAGNLP